MKNFFYTLALVTMFGFMSQAQNSQTVNPQQEKPKQEKVNPDGTKKEEKDVKTGEGDGKDGTRMAITKKGLPASKNNKEAKEKESKENKDVKATDPK